MFGLDYLLYNISVEQFRNEYRGKKALVIPGDENRFADMFGWDDINHLSKYTRSNYDGLKLVYEKQGLAPTELTRLDHWLHKGATLICNNVNDIDPVVGRFCSTLEKDLNTAININSYTSCPTKQGFDKHHDQHDVFIIQTEGVKKWVVFEPTFRYPLHELGNSSQHNPPDSDPYIECELSKGDVLYIPRGHWHYAIAVTPSIHLTVGPVARSASQFLFWMTSQMMKNEEFFRQDFPLVDTEFLGGKTPDTEFDAHLNEMRDRLNKLLEFSALKEAYTRYCMTSNPLTKHFQYPQGWTLTEDINEHTAFVFPPDQKTVVRYEEEEKKAVLYCRGFTLVLNDIPESFLASLFSAQGDAITGKKIMAACSEIDWPTTRKTLLELFENGVLLLADAEDQ